LMMAREAVMRARAEATEPLGLTNHAVLAILMAAASTEAFIIETAESVPSAFSTAFGADEVPPAVNAFADVVQRLEREREPITEKYIEASLALAGKAFDKGASPYQDFKLLIDLRNAIMHIKPTVEGDRRAGERVTDALARRGLAVATGPGLGSLPWFDRLMTKETALWAHDSALAMIRALLDLFPAPAHYDPLEMTYRHFFRILTPIT
jgi:hypothetical protein